MPDLGNSSVFNQADASNASGTMPSWSGAAAPSTLDDAGRALQGAVTREWNWRSYTLTAGGTADAKTLTYSVAPAAYYNGQRFAFIANTTNTTSATLNVNSLGAKVIKTILTGTLTNLAASDMLAGEYVEVAYNTANDCFVWVNQGAPQALGTGDSPQFAGVNVGNASDTTITRSVAGVIAVEGGVIPKENRANTFSADQTIATGASQALLTLDANAAVSKSILMTTATLNRWLISSENTAESGSNAGSNFIINRYSDAGTYLDTSLTINRATGNVGIGTTPTDKFHVVGPSGGASARFTDNVNSTLVIKHEAGSLLTYEGVGASVHRWVNNSLERMRIDASGNVGIGTTSVAAKLHVNGGDVLAQTASGIVSVFSNSGGVTTGVKANSGGVGTVGTDTNHQLWLMTGNTQRAILGTDGTFVLTSSGGLGYGTGSGGTVTQVTSKLTGVTLNKTNGQITTASNSIAANANASFTVTNSTVAATDNIIVTRASGGTGNRYTVQVTAVAAGSFEITIQNNSAAAQSDVIVINFAVIKSTTA